MPESTRKNLSEPGFSERIAAYTERVGQCLDRALPAGSLAPQKLHEAMRYAVLSGGKRIRPLLVYATGECLAVDADKLDAPATAIELIHAFSLVHDDLPAMDNDDLRRGRPTVHIKYDEATAILAADALQPLAFNVIAANAALSDNETRHVIRVISDACGSLGMTGGQSIDLASEGKKLSAAELAEMHGLKTGALIRACVMSVVCMTRDIDDEQRSALDRFSRDIGLAFQIRDDILDVQGDTEVLGKKAGADEELGKATWPGIFGIDDADRRCRELSATALAELERFGVAADPLRELSYMIVERHN